MNKYTSIEPDPPNISSEETTAEKEKSLFGIIIHSFFIIPFLIAVFCVLLFTAVSLLTREQKTVYDFIEDIKIGSLNKRWQAAFELSKILANPDLVPKDERFTREISLAYKKSEHDDNRIRQYLALAMGRTKNKDFIEPLLDSLKGEKEENLPSIIYALGMLHDKKVLPDLYPFLDHPNSRIRSITVVSIGNIGEATSVEKLKKALRDSEPNVQWGAAISLAQLNDASGEEILLNILNRGYLTQFAEIDPQEQNQLLLSALQVSGQLKRQKLDAKILEIAEHEENMKIRALAMDIINERNLRK